MRANVFYTSNMKRVVYGGGGVSPDITTEREKIPPFIQALWRDGVFLSFSSEYINKNKITNHDFEITENIIDDFEEFYNNLETISYTLPGEKELERMKIALGIDEDAKISIFQEDAFINRYIKKMV